MSTEPSFTTRFLGEAVFSGAHNRQAETSQPTFEGATAALETFWRAPCPKRFSLFAPLSDLMALRPRNHSCVLFQERHVHLPRGNGGAFKNVP